ncbi:MAG TPA: alpha/beta fold hydrolase [Chloroflexota bacterium]|nr:alpha/beta fold hydrolase [Chloroflexota bacterium]
MVAAQPETVDSRIHAAMSHWAPRFVANGVDMNDFFRVTAGIERWEDWCGAWAIAGGDVAELAEEAEAAGNSESAAAHFVRAALLYHFGKFLFFESEKQARDAHERTVALYNRALPYLDPTGERVEIPYEDGAVIPGILRRPVQVVRPPIVILVPGLDSVKEELHGYSEDLLARGMATLAIDGPGQGEMERDHAIRYDYEVPIRHVIDWTGGRGDVEPSRVGLLGVSLGGYYAARAATQESRLRAAVAVGTGYRLAESFDGLPELTKEAFVRRMKVADRAAARDRLRDFDLSDVIGSLKCRLLVVMGRQDRLFDAGSVEQMVRDAEGRAELLMYEEGNHVCNNIPYKCRPRQADWLRERLKEV